MKTSKRGIELLIRFEGYRANAYLDPIGIPTIGFGFVKGVKMGDTMTLYDAKERLKRELVEYEQGVLSSMTRAPNQNQFDACVVFAFNVGVAGFKKSSVLKAHNRGDEQAAARAFALWNRAGGKTWPGLTRRRAAEAALYLEPTELEHVEQPEMPQQIEPETPMTASSINRASVVAGGTASLAAVSQTINDVNEVKYGVSALGDWLVPALLVAVVALAGYIVYERVKQRKGGWA